MRATASREIGIDAGHRVTDHASKCRNIHGHRYTIQAHVDGELAKQGASNGMTVDFGFLKDLMMKKIDEPCDHGLILWAQDPLLDTLPELSIPSHALRAMAEFDMEVPCTWQGGKLLVLRDVPTAENLARHWFHQLKHGVDGLSHGRCSLIAVRVWETPNCWAEFTLAQSFLEL